MLNFTLPGSTFVAELQLHLQAIIDISKLTRDQNQNNSSFYNSSDTLYSPSQSLVITGSTRFYEPAAGKVGGRVLVFRYPPARPEEGAREC